MDWLILWGILAAYLVCIGFSAVYLRRFAKTRDKRALWKGLALLLGLPGLLALWVAGWVLLHSEDYDPGGVMCYMPASLGHSEQDEVRGARNRLQAQLPECLVQLGPLLPQQAAGGLRRIACPANG